MPRPFVAGQPLSFRGLVQRATQLAPHDALVIVRWVTLLLLLLLAWVDPMSGWNGLPAWVFVLLFAGYSLITDLLRRHWRWYRSHRQLAVLDLVVAGGLYLLSQDYAGPLFTLVFLVVIDAALTLSTRGAFLYLVAAVAVVVVVEMTIRQSAPLNQTVVDIGGRVLWLGLVSLGTVLLMHRLALEREATRQAQGEVERFTELDRLRGNFVAAVSHDLQTPLTAVRAGLGMLASSAGDRLRDDESMVLANARRNVDRLALQVNDLLTLNQIEADRFDIIAAPFDLRSVIAGMVVVTHPLIEHKGQVLEVSTGGPLLVEGDRRRLEQALVNLVVNAHRHTPTGTRIAVSGRDSSEGVELQVEDDGPGIPRDAQPRIFERFYRVDTETAGSGLGLTIVKAIVERHDGTIGIKSEPGHGTMVRILLPHYTPKE